MWCWRLDGIDWLILVQSQFWMQMFYCPRRIVYHLGVGSSRDQLVRGQACYWLGIYGSLVYDN